MKAVLLAGGLGTRISEETTLRPKPMIEIGGKPILWHIMRIYAHHGIDDFIVCAGYKGQIIPIHPKSAEIMGHKAYKSVKDVPGVIDTAVFAIPAKFVAEALAECGEKKIPGAVLIPSGFAEAGAPELQEEIVKVGQKYNIRLMGPNIYGFYYTPANLCATFCTAYDVKGSAALSSQSGGIGMAIIGLGWGAIVSLPFAIFSQSVSPARIGLYMGVFNLSVVLPQLAVSLGVGALLAGVENKALVFALGGVCMLASALAWLAVKQGAPHAPVATGGGAGH